MAEKPRRGHVYRHNPTGMRVVVLSNDDYNAGRASVLAAAITRTTTDLDGNEVPYLVNLNETDSISGHVRVADTGQVNAVDLVKPRTDEMLSGASMSNIKKVLDEVFGYDIPQKFLPDRSDSEKGALPYWKRPLFALKNYPR